MITDRTVDDLVSLETIKSIPWQQMTEEQKQSFLRDAKGAYNVSDLVRIGTVLNALASQLDKYGYNISLRVKTNWAYDDIPTLQDLNAYTELMQIIRGSVTVFSDTPDTPDTMNSLYYLDANAIEEFLTDVDLLLKNLALSWFFSGEIYSGE